jgi:Putative methyltransferase
MSPGDHSGTASHASHASHWVRWHAPYEDPTSNLSRRLRTVQSMVREVLDGIPAAAVDAHADVDPDAPPDPETIRIVSMCAGQGRDVIDVVAAHPRREVVSALLVELNPDLVAFARARAAAAGVDRQVRIVEGDAAQSRWYADYVPADVVLVCGVFGNISAADRTRTIQALPGWCKRGAHVIWTRHRRPPAATPAIRADFAAAGFTEVAFVAPEGTVMTVGHHRLDADADADTDAGAETTDTRTPPFDPEATLFDFVGDGCAPA